MGPTWVLSAPDGSMLASWTLLSGVIYAQNNLSYRNNLWAEAAVKDALSQIVNWYICEMSNMNSDANI